MKEQLAKHLKGGEAFQPIDHFLKEIPFEKLGIRPNGLPYSFYELFYHIAFAQKDILDFIVSDEYKTPQWPDDYWPENQAPKNEKEWQQLISDYVVTRQELIDLVQNENNELSKPIKNGNGQTLHREILLVLEHNAYHTGQLAMILRLLNIQPATPNS
ncbi:MAG TPA: DinB family protein [Flavobacteriaceae bacterium]|nr:DinB family protein [Flavobacteriaceae bacterium]